jgi:hypothetical protein
MITIPALTNAAHWNAMHLKADRIPAFDATGRRLCDPARCSIIATAPVLR